MIERMVMQIRKMICLLAISTLLAGAVPQIVLAQLLAYDGFDYETGDLATVGGGTLGGGTGWIADEGWHDNLGGIQPGRLVIEDAPAGWGYTDSQGNQLPTLGRTVNAKNWESANRRIDLSGVDPSLLHDGSGAPERQGKFGADGAEVWFSFLGQGAEIKNAATLNLGGGNGSTDNPDVRTALYRVGLGRPWILRTDGTQDPDGSNNDAWGVIDYQPSVDTLAATGDPYSDKVFFVARIQFEGPSAENQFGDEKLTVWTNSDLGSTAPSEESAKISDFAVWDFVFNIVALGGNADTYFDELRVGLTYGDVAPIAPTGPAADFDSDGDVDGADFLLWQQGFGDSYDATDLANWENEFGTISSALTATAAVPEPASWLLVSAVVMVLVGGRQVGGRISLPW